MLKTTYDVLVLDANSRKALATVRSLGRHGLRVAALEIKDALPVPAFSSRWCHKRFICPAAEGTEEYLSYLESILDEVKIGVLIPSSDGTIALVRRYRARLEQRVRIALASEEALTIAVNKRLTLQIAQRLGIRVPGGISLKGVSEVEMALREVGLPAVVKPTESWVMGEKQKHRAESQLVTTPAEAYKAVAVLTSFGRTVLFQQFLPGRRDSLMLLYAHGDIYARFAHWARRSCPPLGGTSTLFQSMAYPSDIGEQAERLVREIGLEGYVQVEFRRDGAGIPYLMEINSRLAASLAHSIHVGVDFPVLLYQWASGGQIDRVQSYDVGVWMRYLWGDIATTAAAIQQRGRPGVTPPARALFDFFVSCLVPMKYDYVDWDDLLPIWTAIYGRALGGLRRIVKRNKQLASEMPGLQKSATETEALSLQQKEANAQRLQQLETEALYLQQIKANAQHLQQVEKNVLCLQQLEQPMGSLHNDQLPLASVQLTPLVSSGQQSIYEDMMENKHAENDA